MNIDRKTKAAANRALANMSNYYGSLPQAIHALETTLRGHLLNFEWSNETLPDEQNYRRPFILKSDDGEEITTCYLVVALYRFAETGRVELVAYIS